MTKFQSKKDKFVYVAVLLPVLMLTFSAIELFLQNMWASPLLLLFFAIVLLWLFFTTDYEITDEELVVRSAFLKKRVPLASIQRVRKSRSLLAAPALSLDRLEIFYSTYESLLISPAQQQEFLTALQQKNPAVRIEL